MKLIPVICALSFGSLSLPAQTLYAPSGTVGTSTTANVGVGTASPSYKLQVGDATLSAAQMAVFSSSTSYAEVLAVTSGRAIGLIDNFSTGSVRGVPASTMGLGTNQATPLVFSNNATERMRITETGNIGIGTTAPDAPLAFNNVTGEKIHLYVSGGSQYGLAVYSSELRCFAGAAGGGGATTFGVQDGTGAFTELVRIKGNGNVGIGTATPDAKLAVNGTIHAREVIVDTSSAAWSDYVFAPDYRLAPLSEVERHIKAEKRLPGIPSAAEVAERGISVGEMQAKLLAKIEELTLHQIAQEKRTQAAVAALLAENAELRARVDALSQRR